jgi:hypothetical protein
MDKLRLLLSAGTMLGLVAGTANATSILNQDGSPATPTGVGQGTLLDGFSEMGGPYSGYQGLEPETAVPWSVPQPGKVNVRINFFANEFPMAAWWTGMNGNGTGAPGNKQQSYGIYGWVRLDVGLDGETKTGIQYGAFAEFRENNTTNITGSTTPLSVTSPTGTPSTGALTGVSSGFAQGASADSSDNTIYVRHANVYVGTTDAGFLRIGTGLGSQTLYEIGLNDEYGFGGWIDMASSNIPTNLAPVWPWADGGNAYMAARLQYVSPVFDGFDFGISFAPTNAPPFDGSGCSTAYGGNGCTTQSTSTLSGDFGNRYRNELGIALRYRNTFGPVGFAMSGIYTTSGRVDDALAASQPYKGLNIGDIGAAIQFNKQIEISGNVMWGAFDGSWGLQPAGGATSVAWVAGAKYEIAQLPATVGAYYFNYKSQGLAGLPTQRTDQGLTVDATYGMGPGVVVIAEYDWGQRYQGDYDFLTNTTGTSANNQVQAQAATLGMSIRF